MAYASDDEHEDRVVEPGAVGELQVGRAGLHGHQHAEARAGEVPGVDQHAEHLGEGQRHQREVRPAQAVAERERADEGADQRARRHRERAAGPGIEAEAHLQHGADVGAGAEEHRMPEGHLAAVAAEDVPALPEQREEQRGGPEAEPEARLDEKRQHQENKKYDRKNLLHARCPNKPVGRNSSTRMKIRKMPICPRLSPSSRPL